jgi:hypothetical protein
MGVKQSLFVTTVTTILTRSPKRGDRHHLANVSCYHVTLEELMALKVVFAMIRQIFHIGRPVWAAAARRLNTIMLDFFN